MPICKTQVHMGVCERRKTEKEIGFGVEWGPQSTISIRSKPNVTWLRAYPPPSTQPSFPLLLFFTNFIIIYLYLFFSFLPFRSQFFLTPFSVHRVRFRSLVWSGVQFSPYNNNTPTLSTNQSIYLVVIRFSDRSSPFVLKP